MNTARSKPANAIAPETIVVVRALGGLGDILCAIPALTQLRTRYPSARISLVSREGPSAEVLDRYTGLVDGIIPFCGFPGIVEESYSPVALADFLQDWLRQPAADLAIQMHGSGSVANVFTGCLGAKAAAGYHVPGLWVPGPLSWPFPDHLSETQRWCALARRLDCPELVPPRFNVTPADRRALAAIAPQVGERPYVVIHPGASDRRRRWPSERFAAIGNMLGALGLEAVLTGVAEEAEAVGAVRDRLRHDAIDLCGRTSLGATAALLERAQLVLTNDTGISHLAAALGVRSVVIFIASDPARWAPDKRSLHRAVGNGVPDPVIGRPQPSIEPSLPTLAAVEAAVEHQLMVAA